MIQCRMTVLFVSLLIVALISTPCFALPTRNSNIPLAEVIGEGLYRLEVENRHSIETIEGEGSMATHSSSAGILWGAPRFGLAGLELGADFVSPRTENIPEALLFNFRVATMTLEEKRFSGALGIHSLGFVADSNDYNVMYGVIQNKFWNKFYTAVGGYSGNEQLLVDENGNASANGFFLGLWYDVQPNGRGRLGLEWTSGRSQLGRADIGLTVEFDHGIHGNFSLSVPNNSTSNDTSAQFRLAVDL